MIQTLRSVRRVIPAIDSQDGAGVKLKRSVGRNPGSRIDPFLMLDAFSSDDPDDYIAGFPPHPHRGFETVTYMLDGHMLHRDHLGNEGHLRAGGVQWMRAGRGVIHEERPQQEQGLLRGFQLWLNLPAAEKMLPAAYQNIEPEQICHYQREGAEIRVIAGELQFEDRLLKGPVETSTTEAIYLDLSLDAGQEISLPLPYEHRVFIYLFQGEASSAGQPLPLDAASEMTEGERLQITAGSKPARMLLIAGKPINEPVAQYGPFVMNTMEEVEQAISDFRNNCLTD